MVKLLQEDREDFVLKPIDLHAIDEAGINIEDAELVRDPRPIDKDRLESLIQSDPKDWPPVLVTRTDAGYVLVDGYHRKAATIAKKLDEIHATCKTFASEQDIIKASFETNITHGQPLSAASRSNYAYWLHKHYPKMLQRDIAAQAHIKQSTVSVAIFRGEAKARMQPPPVEPEEKQRQRIKKNCQKLMQDAVQIYEDVAALPEQEQRSAILGNLGGGIEEREALLHIAQLIEQVLQARPVTSKPRRKR